jgi:ribosomal protein S18 acetylase RimI-like enzyme
MDDASGSFIFFQVSSPYASDAFKFHQSSTSNEHIWPRTETEIEMYCETGQLFGVRTATGEFVGLCYVTLVDAEREWELGGLAVSQNVQRLHVGSILIRFALAHTIAYQRPWRYKQTIIANVHEDNPKPRNLMKRIGFQFVKRVEVLAEKAPTTMKRNAEGKLCGDKFEFPEKAVVQLHEWFLSESACKLSEPGTSIQFEIPGGLESLREALGEAASESGQ